MRRRLRTMALASVLVGCAPTPVATPKAAPTPKAPPPLVSEPPSDEPRFACFEPGGTQAGDGTCPVSAICELDDDTHRHRCRVAKDPCEGNPFTCACAVSLCGSEGACISAKVEGGGRHLHCFRPGI